jgi:paraquat-inducible protein B
MARINPPPQATVRQGRRFRLSYIWIVPLIAAIVGAYLFYKSEIDVGPTITITFEDGTNVASSSKLVYRGLQVGVVAAVALDASLGHVNVRARLDRPASGLARKGSQFWIVEPRVSVDEITGLSTLLSGSYIQVAPGSGAEATHFVGLSRPPVVASGEQVLSLALEADDVSLLQVGDAITYRGVQVGEITKISLPQEGPSIRIDVAIEAAHAFLVRTNSMFWLASGIHADLSLLHPSVDISSLDSLIRGGISFATPEPEGDPAAAGAVFPLLDEPPATVAIDSGPDGLRVVLRADRSGITANAPVYYRDVQVGQVLSTSLNADASAVDIELVIEPAHASLVNTNSVFWNVSGLRAGVGVSGLQVDVESLSSLLAGGIAFATRGAAGDPVKPGATFPLLAQAPAEPAAASGRRFVLVADSLGSIRANDPVYYRETRVGAVAHTGLAPDGSAVAITIAVEEEHAALVRERSVFWDASGIHAELGLLQAALDVESLEALLAGGIAFATPPDGGPPAAEGAEFRLYSEEEGRKRAQPPIAGLRVVLTGSELGSIAVGDPVYYREVQVGEVTAIDLEDDAAAVLVDAVIRPRYAPLVQEGSMFWNASGLRFDWSLFEGASLDLESLKALLAGGVAFATPEVQGAQAADGSHFALHAKPDDAWLAWRPTVRLGPAEAPPPLPRIAPAPGDFAVADLTPASYAVQTTSHVREGPGTTYRVIDTLAQGAMVEVTGEVTGRDWYRVSLRDGAIGYVWSKLLAPAVQPVAQ